MRTLLAANWKMNPTRRADAVALARHVLGDAPRHADAVEVALFPPYPWLADLYGIIEGPWIGLGAQDCYWEPAGAFTGAVSAAMLADLCDWVIVGHSERRVIFGETDEQVARKAEAAIGAGLRTIVCVGEREEQHVAGLTEQVVRDQLATALRPLTPEAAGRLVVAYEPVWAIGTGRNADPDHADRTMRLIRSGLAEALGEGPAGRIRVLYGGSVNAANVASYVELASCSGCLVGGASLKADEFLRMIEVVARVPGAQP